MKMISVIMPFYKKREYISQAINSVLRQTYKNFEIIIVYDDCDLGDYNFIKKKFSKNKKIKIIKNHNNLGAGFSRNKGIKKSKGEFIAFLDCDDYWEKNKLKQQLNFMDKKKINFVYTSYKIVDKKGNLIGIRKAPNKMQYKDLLINCDIGLSTVLMKKKILSNKINFPKLKTKEDFVLWLKISKKIDLYGIKQNLVNWRHLDNSLSSSTVQKILDGFLVYYKYMNFNFFKSVYYLLCLSFNFIKKNKRN